MKKIDFTITNSSDHRRCTTCRAFVRFRDLDRHAAEHGGIVGKVGQGIKV